MPEPDITGPAPAAAPAPDSAPSAPVSAERAAANAEDFSAFDRAHVAKRQNREPDPNSKRSQQLANYEKRVQEGEARIAHLEARTPAAEATQAPAQTRQQVINDYERRIAEQEQRIRALEASRGPAPAPPPPQPSASEATKARVKQLLTLPDAPNVDEYDSYPEFSAAQALFVQEKLQAEQQQLQGRQQALQARDQAFRERLTAAKTADPTFVERLSDEAKAIGGMDHARRTGQTPGPVHVIGELLYDSPHAAAFLEHISADPTALRTLVTPPPHLAQVPPPYRVQAHIDHLVTEFRRLEGRLAYAASLRASDTASSEPSAPPSSVSAAPPPPPTLSRAGHSTDPLRAAVNNGDFARFDALEMKHKIAQRQGRAS